MPQPPHVGHIRWPNGTRGSPTAAGAVPPTVAGAVPPTVAGAVALVSMPTPTAAMPGRYIYLYLNINPLIHPWISTPISFTISITISIRISISTSTLTDLSSFRDPILLCLCVAQAQQDRISER